MAEVAVPTTAVPTGGKAWGKWALGLGLTVLAVGAIAWGASKGWNKGKTA